MLLRQERSRGGCQSPLPFYLSKARQYLCDTYPLGIVFFFTMLNAGTDKSRSQQRKWEALQQMRENRAVNTVSISFLKSYRIALKDHIRCGFRQLCFEKPKSPLETQNQAQLLKQRPRPSIFSPLLLSICKVLLSWLA